MTVTNDQSLRHIFKLGQQKLSTHILSQFRLCEDINLDLLSNDLPFMVKRTFMLEKRIQIDSIFQITSSALAFKLKIHFKTCFVSEQYTSLSDF